MNNVYFGCTKCKTYIDAGYRWGYWQLEKPGFVAHGEIVDIDRLLSIDRYWKPEPNEQSSWLTSTLAQARNFVLRHNGHSISYGDMERLLGVDADYYEQFDWMNENPGNADLQPRNFVEHMGIRTWGEVESYVGSLPQRPWWYASRQARVVARRKFDEILASTSRIPPRLK
jgi:hypothetical protein